ncbi:MAG TPA: S41 family peptidase [Thermoanaerobaculia bacterium]|nr:S41 family peptidase [Thermoanaerobaculia bacterium]
MKMWKVIALLFVFVSGPAFSWQAPVNLDFEQGQAGQAPPGWTVPSDAAGFSAQVSSEKPESGKASGMLAGAGVKPDTVGNLIQSVDAAPYQGKRIRFRAAVRAEPESPGGRSRLWIGLDRPGSGNGGRFDATSPIVTPEWVRYEITAEVPEDTRMLNLGLVLVGNGRAWIDSASLEILGAIGEGDEPARALAGRELDNLVAFAKLLGYVRFFHPSDQVASADWEKLALAGVQKAEKAGSPEDLAQTLETFFLPVAPTVRVFPTDRRPALPAELAAPAGNGAPEIITWSHSGVALSKQGSVYRSERVTQGPGREPGSFAQYIDAKPLQGKPVRLRVAVRTDGPGARLALTTFSRGQQQPAPLSEREVAATAGAWRVEELSATVPAGVEALGVELQLASGERSFWDDATLEIQGEAPPSAPLLENGSFEEVGPQGSPAGWGIEGPVERAGYGLASNGEHPHSGSRSAVLSYTKPSQVSPAEPFVADLGGGVSAIVPLALYKDSRGTLPHVPTLVRPPAPEKPEGFVPTGNDRATRLADVALAWTVFQHFYPYFDVVKTDWPAELPRALFSAATDKDAAAFLTTLRRMVAALHDGHGNVFHPSEPGSHNLPLVWDWVEDRLVITAADPEKAPGVSRGDVVTAIDGQPAGEVLAAREEVISSATPQWKRFRALRGLLMGAENEEVRLALQSPSGETKTVTVRRSVSFQQNPRGFDEPRPEPVAEIRPGIFYVDLDRVEEEEFKAAVDRLAAAKGIVFDMRGYPNDSALLAFSHLIDAPMYTARWQVPQIARPDREGMTFDFSNWPVKPAPPRFQAKVAFVTDGRAISYAETCMGMIEAYKVAPIVGAPTAGTNGNINPFTLPGGYRLVWTGMRVTKHDGSQHHGVGILPTIPVSRTLKGVAEGKDEFLEKAIEVVSR